MPEITIDVMADGRRWRVHTADAAVAAILLVLLAYYGIGSVTLSEPGLPGPDPAAYALGIAATLPLLFWRRFPVLVFGVVAGAVAGYLALGYAFGPVMFQLIAATTLLTWKRRGRPLLWVSAGYGVVLIGAFLVRYMRLTRDPVQLLVHWPASALLWLVLPAVVGVSLRLRQEAAARARVERSRRAAAEEQLRMAQELHDVVGHGLAVIAMQAGAGRHVLERDPQRTGQALTAIQETARTTLDGLRAEVATLHTDGAQTGDAAGAGDGRDADRLNPRDGIADLPRLVERIRSGGVTVELDCDPELDPPSLPAETDRAAYRIAQESLTNVLRHAGPRAAARLQVRTTGADLLVEVTNTEPARAGGRAVTSEVVPGVGIRGMRARARRLGGRVDAARRAGGGFRVSARLPLPALSPARRS